MTIKEKIKNDILVATKNKDDSTKNILKVVLGDINTQEGRGLTLTDEQIYNTIRKILQGVEEMLTYKPNDTTLLKEKTILSNLVPNQLTKSDIIAELSPKLEELKNAKSDGQATGIAVKFFKENKKSVDGTLVGTVVKELRNVL